MDNLERTYRKVARNLGIDSSLVKEMYQSYWKEIRDYVSSLPLHDNMDEEEFAKLRTNVNIPSLGKLYCTWKSYLRTNKRKEYAGSKKGKTDI